MYGAIYGDLVGSIYEFSQLKEIKGVNPAELIVEESFFSDDTILTIAILDAIIHDKNYDMYLRKYIEEYKDYKPNFKPCFKISFSPNLIEWSTKNNIGTSHGNGAMMRISPVGFMFDNEEDIIKNVTLATIPSHNSKEAIESAKVVALIIFYLRKGYSKREIFNRMNLSIKYKTFSKFNLTCEDTIGNCLYAFYNSDSFEDAIRSTLLMGGDTDTNCAIVGGMAEALYGMDNSLIERVNKKLPEKFVEVLNEAKKIIK